ncbi:YggS family pyridoxal phosphate-dependent enzyme [Xanthomonas albilineans]|uniref:Pyridoxal phosphate homeostasis protein n=2 Tax=Xanthomonas albilineans TaxID=29447 RepID=D2UEP8_XANAP|nr:putative alanine racemase protein [Xanthomonas albilineans GPE PC73]
MSHLTLQQIRLDMERAADAAGRPPAQLLAVSKTQTAAAVAALAAQGQRAFGENYVQEAADKVAALAEAGLEWHLIGHLQSNKAELAATLFDWVQSVDRPKLIAPLAKGRPSTRGPLNVLIQVNIDDEASKHGCHPDQIEPLAIAIAAQPALALRGLMAIPAPWPEAERREAAFIRMRTLFEHLRDAYPRVDTLSMGMSGDFAQAIAAGATLVRIGTALFGARGDASPRA